MAFVWLVRLKRVERRGRSSVPWLEGGDNEDGQEGRDGERPEEDPWVGWAVWAPGRSGEECGFGWAVCRDVQVETLVDSEMGFDVGERTEPAPAIGVTGVEVTGQRREIRTEVPCEPGFLAQVSPPPGQCFWEMTCQNVLPSGPHFPS